MPKWWISAGHAAARLGLPSDHKFPQGTQTDPTVGREIVFKGGDTAGLVAERRERRIDSTPIAVPALYQAPGQGDSLVSDEAVGRWMSVPRW